jgi:gas vesicle protein
MRGEVMSNHDKNFSLSAFLVGGILGASASLLFTPRSGKELRADIKRRTDDYLKEVELKRDTLINRSKSTAGLLKRKAEDLTETIKSYANGKIEKPLSVIEREIEGLKSAINAARASYSSIPEIYGNRLKGNGQSVLNEYDDEQLPKHIGMGKGRSRKSFYS